MLARLKQDGGAERLQVPLRLGERLRELSLAFPSAHERCSRLHSESSVTRAVDEGARAEDEAFLGGLPFRMNTAEPSVLRPGADHGCVQEKLEVRFAAAFVEQQEIHQGWRTLWILHRQIQSDLLDDAALAQLRLQGRAPVEARCAHDVHPHFAGGVATKDGPVLAEDDPRAQPRRRQRAAHPGHSAARHEDVAIARVFREEGHGRGTTFRFRWPPARPACR